MAKKAVETADADGLVPKTTFTDDRAIAEFGVGRNMVAAIKHWALACDVLVEDESRRNFQLSPAGREIFLDEGLIHSLKILLPHGMHIGAWPVAGTVPPHGIGFSMYSPRNHSVETRRCLRSPNLPKPFLAGENCLAQR